MTFTTITVEEVELLAQHRFLHFNQVIKRPINESRKRSFQEFKCLFPEIYQADLAKYPQEVTKILSDQEIIALIDSERYKDLGHNNYRIEITGNRDDFFSVIKLLVKFEINTYEEIIIRDKKSINSLIIKTIDHNSKEFKQALKAYFLKEGMDLESESSKNKFLLSLNDYIKQSSNKSFALDQYLDIMQITRHDLTELVKDDFLKPMGENCLSVDLLSVLIIAGKVDMDLILDKSVLGEVRGSDLMLDLIAIFNQSAEYNKKITEYVDSVARLEEERTEEERTEEELYQYRLACLQFLFKKSDDVSASHVSQLTNEAEEQHQAACLPK